MMIMVIDGKRSDESRIRLFSKINLDIPIIIIYLAKFSRQYSTTEKLANLVIDCVDHTIDNIIEKEGLDKPFVPFDYIYNLFLNILSASAFGRRYRNFIMIIFVSILEFNSNRYDMNEPEYEKLKYIMKDLLREANTKIPIWESFPLYRMLDPRFKRLKETLENYFVIIKDKYQAHYKDYDEIVIRDFCDTLITAKNEALREGKESAPYLTDDNLSMAVVDLFFAGTNTSQTIFRWALLHMFYDKVIEKKLREEIENEIGDRIPTHEDRNRCHYVMAFLSEVLRFSNIVPTGVQHRALVTTKIGMLVNFIYKILKKLFYMIIGDYTIPEHTEVIVFQGHILHKEEYWTDPQQFKPERFLDSNGKYLTTRPKAFIPFGVGRRVCLGEKLAIADLFLVLVRFLQKTNDYEIVLHMTNDENPLLPDPNLMEYHPKSYKISLHKRN